MSDELERRIAALEQEEERRRWDRMAREEEEAGRRIEYEKRLASIRARVEEVRNYAAAGDHEAAHATEDRLHEAVLREIAGGHRRPAGLARAALKTRKIAFDRWGA